MELAPVGQGEVDITFAGEDFGEAFTPGLRKQDDRKWSEIEKNARNIATRKENAMQVQSYLFFDGRCEEALDFYKKALGANVEMMMRFNESPEPTTAPPGSDNKILHASFRIGDTQVLASDGHPTGNPTFKGFGLTLNPKTEAEADRLFGALGEGGQVQMPLAKTFFSPRFGMVSDKFGVLWMVMAEQPA